MIKIAELHFLKNAKPDLLSQYRPPQCHLLEPQIRLDLERPRVLERLNQSDQQYKIEFHSEILKRLDSDLIKRIAIRVS